MVFWKEELAELQRSKRSFSDIYKIMTQRFSSEVFAQEYRHGEIIRTTYKELFEGVQTVASALKNRFPDSYNRFVAIRMDNSPLWVMCFFGSLMAGLRPMLVNTRLDESSVEYALRVSDSLCVLVDRDSDKEGYINANSFEKASFTSGEWADEIVLMSSGTTGTPKLVIYDGKAMCEQILLSGWIVRNNPAVKHDRKVRIRLIALLPFYHIFGLSTTLMWFGFFGRTLIFPPGMDSQSIQFACKLGGATHFFAIPLVWNTAVKKLLSEAKRQGKEQKLRKAVKFSNSLQSVFPRFGAFVARNVLFKDVRNQVFGRSLTFCISGGGFISEETVEIMNGLGYSLHCGYGMTETGITSVELSRKPRLRNQNTVGKPFPIIDYKINDKGELLVKGGTLCSGFLTQNGAVARNKDEYFNTGDMCTVDSRGRWVLLGRRDDVIIGENGENINPDLVERLIEVPITGTVCVIGMETDSEVRPVVIVALPVASSSYEQARVAEKLYTKIDAVPITQRPSKVYITFDEIPESLGKVKRAQLRTMISEGRISLVELKRPDKNDFEKIYDESILKILDDIKECFAQVLSKDVSEIEDDAHFIYDLGGESMSYFNLVAVISKRYGKELRLEQDVALFTPLDFAREIIGSEK